MVDPFSVHGLWKKQNSGGLNNYAFEYCNLNFYSVATRQFYMEPLKLPLKSGNKKWCGHMQDIILRIATSYQSITCNDESIFDHVTPFGSLFVHKECENLPCWKVSLAV